MSTTEASELPTQPTGERPHANFYAFCSLVLPGLGQLLQKRPAEAVGFFLLFLMSGFLPVLIVSLLFRDRFSHASIQMHLLHMVLFGGLFFLFVAAITWAVVDAARGQNEKTEEKKEEPSKKQRKPAHHKIIDILVGIAISGLLIAFLLPGVPSAREAARRMQCSNNMKQIVQAFHHYYDEYGHFPPAYTVDDEGKPLHSWRVLILPYIDVAGREYLCENIRLDEPWDSEHNQQFHSKAPSIFCCPSVIPRNSREEEVFVPVPSGCFYSVIVGSDSAFFGSEPRTKPDAKVLGETIFLVERRVPVNWMDPSRELSFDAVVREHTMRGINVDAMEISSYHPGGVNVALGDGSVRFLPDSMDGEILRKMLTLFSQERGGVSPPVSPDQTLPKPGG